ncbi:zinc ribbon domain-containing protein [bacterium]|nr:zinc ribbon domain-containing protein [bacterium]
MPIEVLKCPSCAAPVPPEARGLVACSYCGSTLSGMPESTPGPGADVPDLAAERWNDRGLPRVGVAGRLYVLLGKLGEGDGSDVFLARRDALLTEMVVLKVARALADQDLLDREWSALEALSRSEAKGSDYFSGLLPQRVGHGPLARADGLARKASVFRWRSGFQHTLEDVRAAFPDGVDPRTAVWMWKRVLELLGWVHASGWAHGAVLPRHVLVHPRDHGIVLCGWSSAARADAREPVAALSARARPFYTDELWAGAPPSRAGDIAMSARSMIHVMGGDPVRGTLPLAVPEPLGVLLATCADPSEPRSVIDDTWELLERVAAAARAAFGEPKFQAFKMPGWA